MITIKKYKRFEEDLRCFGGNSNAMKTPLVVSERNRMIILEEQRRSAYKWPYPRGDMLPRICLHYH